MYIRSEWYPYNEDLRQRYAFLSQLNNCDTLRVTRQSWWHVTGNTSVVVFALQWMLRSLLKSRGDDQEDHALSSVCVHENACSTLANYKPACIANRSCIVICVCVHENTCSTLASYLFVLSIELLTRTRTQTHLAFKTTSFPFFLNTVRTHIDTCVHTNTCGHTRVHTYTYTYIHTLEQTYNTWRAHTHARPISHP